MTYTRSQNFTNTMVIEHEIQTFKVMVVVLLLLLSLSDVLSITLFNHVATNPSSLEWSLASPPKGHGRGRQFHQSGIF